MKQLLQALLLALPLTVAAQSEYALSADAAAQVLAKGAMVVDVRNPADYHAGHLPGAVNQSMAGVPLDKQTLQAMVSSLGLDLSRDVLVVGQPGDLQAQQLQASLAVYATGRVLWLVGGTHEWVLSGRALESGPVALPAVPQYLVALQNAPAAPRMAGAALRDTPQAIFRIKLASGPRS